MHFSRRIFLGIVRKSLLFVACYDSGWSKAWYADKAIFANQDIKAIDILLSHGYVIGSDELYERYVLMRKQIKRKTIGLDPCLLWDVPSPPSYESVPLFFGKKAALYRNQRRKEDYEDRLREYQRFVNWFGADRIKKLCEENRRVDESATKVLNDIVKNW